MDGKKIVIKLGTKAIYDSTLDEIRSDVIFGLVRDVTKLLKMHCEIIIISSGAVGCGGEIVSGNGGLGVKQARAAVGQTRLMMEYENVFSAFGLHVAQFLLNKDDLNSDRLSNVKATYENLGENVIPIVNENDVTTTDELTFGDNDGLAAEILEKFDFDVLLVLTDLGVLISKGERILKTDCFDVSSYDNLNFGDIGAGGLESKLLVARNVIEMEKKIVIAKAGDSVIGVLSGECEGTWFCKSLKV